MADSRDPSNPVRVLDTLPAGSAPLDRFWPYVEVPELPTDEELAALDPEIGEVLFGRTERAFSITVSFPCFEDDHYEQALQVAESASEYRSVGNGERLRHRARFYPDDAAKLRELYELVDGVSGCEVLVDDRPLPYARELWLPLMWILLASFKIRD